MALDPATHTPCHECDGTGRVETMTGSTPNGLGGPGGWDPVHEEVDCDECDGTGWIENEEAEE